MPVIRRKNRHKKIPRVSSVAKLWTGASNPDRIEKVPETQHGRVTILRTEIQEWRRGRITEWIRAVANTQGIKEAFSTGSRNHQPPRPNSWWAHQLPGKMPTVKNHRHVKIQIRIGSWSWSDTTVFAPALQQRGEVVVSFCSLRTTRFACSLPVSTSAPVQSEEKAKKRRQSSMSRLLLLRNNRAG